MLSQLKTERYPKPLDMVQMLMDMVSSTGAAGGRYFLIERQVFVHKATIIKVGTKCPSLVLGFLPEGN